jgi:Flp pilus assembly protein TadG
MKVKAMRNLMQKLGERLRWAAAPRQARGQSLIIVAMAFVGLAAMVGLAIDGGILFISQAHLRRAVDAAAVAAATQMRVGQTPESIQRFALQFIKMNGVDPNTVAVSLFDYNNDLGGVGGQMTKDCHWQGVNLIDPGYDKYGLCRVPQRKLIRVSASAVANFAFMPLVGIISTTVTADAVSESASVDAVIVLDTSNSMGDDTQLTAGATTFGADTSAAWAACNAQALKDPKNIVGNCRPLMDAKEAAKIFVRRLYPDYDRVAIVNFDFKAHAVAITDTKPSISSPTYQFSYVRKIRNADPTGLNQGKGACPAGSPPEYYNSECDDDPATPAVSESTGIYRALDSVQLGLDHKPWVEVSGNYDYLANWGKWNPLDYTCNWSTWGTIANCPGHPRGTRPPDPNGLYSTLSTCTGCGIRVAGNLLKLNGRPSALWIIVFLSDGGVNVSDVPGTATDVFLNPGISALEYPNGYCGVPTTTVTVTVAPSLWVDSCVNKTFSSTTRMCGPYHDGQTNCPPGATWGGLSSPPYDALDYARDMIDSTALQVNCPGGVATASQDCGANNGNGGTSTLYNINEHQHLATGPSGANVAIYAIGLGNNVAVYGNPVTDAEQLLRYMAAVGDDGDRVTDPCLGVASATSCGNYYFASGGGSLQGVFEDIAKRVFTRLSK